MSKSHKFTDDHSHKCNNTFTALGMKIMKSVKIKYNINSSQNNVKLFVFEMSPEDIVCGRSLMMAEAARSNCNVSWRLGQVAVVLGKVPVVLPPPPAGYGVEGVLELLPLLLPLCSDMLDTC